MFRLCSWLAAFSLLFTLAPVQAVAPPRDRVNYPGADDLARKIDRHLETAWKKAVIVPAAAAQDGEWLRRVYLDIAGRIPSVTESRAFLADTRPDRRRRVIESLLESPRFVTHFGAVWSALLLPEASTNLQIRFQAPAFERRIQNWLRSGKGVDAFASDLITAPFGGGDNLNALYTGGEDGLAAYYAGKDYKPEEIAASVSRVFLGVNIGCAQCHNHPFAEWNRDQFWSFAAFFGGIGSTRMGDFSLPDQEKASVSEITIPNTNKKVRATFLDGKKAQIAPGARSRQVLAQWVVARNNPYFAKAMVNRTWAYLFGTGLMEPIDEMAGTNTDPYHPEILNQLAAGFTEHDFDLRWLIRTITSTRAYALSSRRTHPSQDDPTRFSRAFLRGLTAHQLFDSLAQATGYREGPADASYGFNPNNANTRGQFIAKFSGASDRAVDVQTSILQALTLMNGKLTIDSTNVQQSETLAAVTDAPFMTLQGKIETLYLATLTRKPTPRELSRLTAYVEKGGSATETPTTDVQRDKQQAEALADVFWSLINSGEFYLNH